MRPLLFSLVFLSTLRSWHFYGLGLSADNLAFGVILAMMLMYRKAARDIPREAIWLVFGGMLSIAGGLAVTVFNNSGTIKLETPFSIFLYSIFGLVTSAAIAHERWRKGFLVALKWTILIHAAFLFVHLIAMWAFGVELNFHEYVTGEPSRNIGGSQDNIGVGFFFRPSGLLNEPGTYATYLLPLTALYLILRRYRADWVLHFALLSFFATFSAQGVVGGIIVACVLFYFNRNWYSTILMPIIGSIGFVTAVVSIWERFFVSDELSAPSASTRVEALQAAFSTLWGNGFIFPTIDIADSTTFVYWWWYSGIFAAPLLLMFVIFGLRNWRTLALLFLLLFMGKVPAAAPLYWLVIGAGLGLAKLEEMRWRGVSAMTRLRRAAP